MKIRYYTKANSRNHSLTSDTTKRFAPHKQSKEGLSIAKRYMPIVSALDVKKQVSSEYKPGWKKEDLDKRLTHF